MTYPAYPWTRIAGNGSRGFVDGDPSVSQIGNAMGMALSNDGSKLYICDTTNDAVRVLDTSTNVMSTLISGITFPTFMCVGPSTGHLYVSQSTSGWLGGYPSGGLIKEYTAAGAFVRNVWTEQPPDSSYTSWTPRGCCCDPTETYLWMSFAQQSNGAGIFRRITLSTLAVAGAGFTPQFQGAGGLAVSPVDSCIYAATTTFNDINRFKNDLSNTILGSYSFGGNGSFDVHAVGNNILTPDWCSAVIPYGNESIMRSFDITGFTSGTSGMPPMSEMWFLPGDGNADSGGSYTPPPGGQYIASVVGSDLNVLYILCSSWVPVQSIASQYSDASATGSYYIYKIGSPPFNGESDSSTNISGKLYLSLAGESEGKSVPQAALKADVFPIDEPGYCVSTLHDFGLSPPSFNVGSAPYRMVHDHGALYFIGPGNEVSSIDLGTYAVTLYASSTVLGGNAVDCIEGDGAGTFWLNEESSIGPTFGHHMIGKLDPMLVYNPSWLEFPDPGALQHFRYGADGQIYVLYTVTGGTDRVYKIDPATAAISTIAALDVATSTGITYFSVEALSDGTLWITLNPPPTASPYHGTGNVLRRYDPGLGTFTDINAQSLVAGAGDSFSEMLNSVYADPGDNLIVPMWSNADGLPTFLSWFIKVTKAGVSTRVAGTWDYSGAGSPPPALTPASPEAVDGPLGTSMAINVNPAKFNPTGISADRRTVYFFDDASTTATNNLLRKLTLCDVVTFLAYIGSIHAG